MTIDTLQAARAYAQTLGVTQNAQQSPSESTPAAVTETDFQALVQEAVLQTRANLNTAETAATAVVTGEASLVDVVTAISAAEVSLEAAIAVRNRMIEAYQEIMRMPI